MRRAVLPLITAAVVLSVLCVSSAWAQSVSYVNRDSSGSIHDGSSWCRAFPFLQDALAIDVDGADIHSVPCHRACARCSDDGLPPILSCIPGNACGPCPFDDPDDIDGNSVCTTNDNVPVDPNGGQQDLDGDGLGDVCDPYPAHPTTTPMVMFVFRTNGATPIRTNSTRVPAAASVRRAVIPMATASQIATTVAPGPMTPFSFPGARTPFRRSPAGA